MGVPGYQRRHANLGAQKVALPCERQASDRPGSPLLAAGWLAAGRRSKIEAEVPEFVVGQGLDLPCRPDDSTPGRFGPTTLPISARPSILAPGRQPSSTALAWTSMGFGL